MNRFLFTPALMVVLMAQIEAQAEENSKVKLSVIAKNTIYQLDTGGLSTKAYKQKLLDLKMALMKGEETADPPAAPAIDLSLEIKNISMEEITIYVGGNPCFHTFEIKGPGVVELNPRLIRAAIFAFPRAIKLAAGKSYELPIHKLADGSHGDSRWIYWTETGEYTLTASYKLGGPNGAPGPVLKSEPVTFKIEQKK